MTSGHRIFGDWTDVPEQGLPLISGPEIPRQGFWGSTPFRVSCLGLEAVLRASEALVEAASIPRAGLQIWPSLFLRSQAMSSIGVRRTVVTMSYYPSPKRCHLQTGKGRRQGLVQGPAGFSLVQWLYMSQGPLRVCCLHFLWYSVGV